jgi:hypothetical protein
MFINVLKKKIKKKGNYNFVFKKNKIIKIYIDKSNINFIFLIFIIIKIDFIHNIK